MPLLLPKNLACVVLTASDGQLFAAELALIKPEGNLRSINSFKYGRLAAHAAMVKLGEPATPILRGNAGEPIWPKGILGSISHSGDYGCALVGRAGHYLGLGIDIEIRKELKQEVSTRICSPLELARIDCRNDLNTIAIFAAKEAIFKCLFPSVGRHFGYRAVALQEIKTNGCLSFITNEELEPQFALGTEIPVQIDQTEQYTLAVCALPQPLLTVKK